MKVIITLLLLATPTFGDHCRVRQKAVIIKSTGSVIVPYAVPVATPVATVLPGYTYSHRDAAGAYAQSEQAALYQEFLAWRAQRQASRPQVASEITDADAKLFATSNERYVHFLEWHQKNFPNVPIDKPMSAEDLRIGAHAYVSAHYREFLAWKAHRQATAQAAPPTVVSQRCVACHNGSNAKTDFRFDNATSDQLRHAIERVADGTMPPEGKPRLTAEENGKVIHELATMPAVDAARPQVQPGPPPEPMPPEPQQ